MLVISGAKGSEQHSFPSVDKKTNHESREGSRRDLLVGLRISKDATAKGERDVENELTK